MSLLIFVFHSLRSLRFFYVLKSFLSVTNTPITFGLFDLISILSGDIKLTESNAIIRYIARKHGLDGKTEKEKVYIDMMENLSLSLYMEFARLAYSPDFVSI